MKEMQHGVQKIISSTNSSLPVGAVTYPGGFEERAEAYVVAQELGIDVGVAHGWYTYMFSKEDCEIVQEYIRRNRMRAYMND